MSAPVFAAPYPVNLKLVGHRALVVGGGPIGYRKALGLVAAGAAVTVVAPNAIDEIRDHEAIRWHERPYQRGEVASFRIAITATNDPAVNAQVARDGRAANVFVNSADDPANCEFILPSVVRRGDLQVAVSTNGRSPALSRWLRQQLEHSITDVHAQLLDVLSDVRDEVTARFGTSEVDGWSEAIDDELIQLITDGDHHAARERVRRAVGLATSEVPT